MNDTSDFLPNFHHEEFEMQMRGYSRRQVDEYVARRNKETRDLEARLARALDEAEHLRREISTVRQQALSGRPAHEEVSERIGQILKLAEDEAMATKGKADQEISELRAEAQRESDLMRTDAREQAERMLTAAQEQAERTISVARGEADKLRETARTDADRLTAESRAQADAALSEAKTQAKRMLDEATARASAIHDGAERRLNLLSTRHAETVRRLTDILEGVQGLVAAEGVRMSLEEEVNQTVSNAIAALEPARRPERASGPLPLGPSDSGPQPSARTNAGPQHQGLRPVVHPVTVHRDFAFGAQAPGPVNGPTGSAPGAGGPPETSGTPGADDSPEASSATAFAGSVLGDTPAGPGQSGGPDSPDTQVVQGSASSGQGPHPAGRHATPMPPPPDMARRFGAPSPEGPGSAIPMPSGLPLAGPVAADQPSADPNGRQASEGHAEGRHVNPPGFIDPDEPTEGLRIMR